MSNKARTTQVEWLRNLGVKFVGVAIFAEDQIIYEDHVDDATTLPDTIAMSMEKRRARAAVYPWMGRWALSMTGAPLTKKLRYFDTREAAEMVAIHNG